MVAFSWVIGRKGSSSIKVIPGLMSLPALLMVRV